MVGSRRADDVKPRAKPIEVALRQAIDAASTSLLFHMSQRRDSTLGRMGLDMSNSSVSDISSGFSIFDLAH